MSNGSSIKGLNKDLLKEKKNGLTKEKVEWFNRLKDLKIPNSIIKEEYKTKYKLKKNTLEELVKKANIRDLAELYSEYRFAGKPSIYLHYIESFNSYSKDELILQINGRILKKLKSIDYLDIPTPHVVEKYGKIYVFFTNLKETAIVWDSENRINEERIIPDFPVMVLQANNPIVQIRTSITSSLSICREIIEYYLSDPKDYSCCFEDAEFRTKVLAKFKRATSIGLVKQEQRGTAQRVQLADPYNVLDTAEYYDQKNKGAVENFVYLVDDEGNIAVQINFNNDKLIFRKYTSEKKINEIMDVILGIANESGLFKNRTSLYKFLGKDL